MTQTIVLWDLLFTVTQALPTAQKILSLPKLICDIHLAACFTGKAIADNRHGPFSNSNAGVVHGRGRTQPRNVVNDKANAVVINCLSINSAPFPHLSGYAAGT
ncbi:hypothetical protein BDP27DRAFT_1328126 [Rhodocollybia butyracea]|uniref:Secreted protein n=1 Tax=Rhodocollybia butyracea TaxID=206335 RepID=A0A9P5U6K1_9AGAR|nr:hypothetical protein BDP27DRAFT_1328126 [Rhodocollybia butyracea]